MLEDKPSELRCNSNINEALILKTTWKKDNLTIDSSNNLDIVLNENQRQLQFRNLSHVLHKGKYSCSLRLNKNNQEITSSSYILLVKCKIYQYLS